MRPDHDFFILFCALDGPEKPFKGEHPQETTEVQHLILVTPVAKTPDPAFYLFKAGIQQQKVACGKRKTLFKNAESKLGARLGQHCS